jgi:hypothetical protein
VTRTWTRINAKLDEFLGVPVIAGKTELNSGPLRVESWNWAQDIFVHHTPLQKRQVLEVEADGRVAILPSDLYAIDRVYDANYERWWYPTSYRPGDVQYQDPDTLEFWTWDNQMFLESEISPGSTDLTLYYWAYYPPVEYTTGSDGAIAVQEESVKTPRWGEAPLIHLATAFLMQPGEVFASDINEYKILVDSGNPEHNPRAQSAMYHLNWYDALMGRFPAAQVGRHR